MTLRPPRSTPHAAPAPDPRRRATLGLLGAGLVLPACSGAQADAPGSGSTGGQGGAGAGGAIGGGGAATGGAAGAGGSLCREPTAGCWITEDNILGPYYKAGAPFDGDLRSAVANGTLLDLEGTVYGCDCVTPLAGALVDVWQANAEGAYDQVGFTLRGRIRTDPAGRYAVRTVVPGFYLNGAQYRPAHIHYKVSHPDGRALTTQLYFEGDPYLATDAFQRPSLVMPVERTTDAAGSALWRVRFDVVLA